ncbi:MAG TPA: glutamate synthase-related protein [Holophaga sp.]|nr:glutamate synthase-related protein [Holophaga sp.]
MSYSSPLGTPVTHTHLKSPAHLCDVSGMCANCTADCLGPCEIGLSAIRGAEAVNPFAADINQFASEKRYPLDFSAFTINGRVFGAQGCAEDADLATFPRVRLQSTFGRSAKVPLDAPFLLPAMAKLNWKDYFAGAALAGVPAVIGEDVVAKDKALEMADGRVTASPLLAAMVEAFQAHHRGAGRIILQGNFDDEAKGVLEHAITHLGVKAVELKFGQAAKGIQGYGKVPDLAEARRFQKMGYLIHPDPSDPAVAEAHAQGRGPVFEKIGKLPLWNPEGLIRRVAELRDLGAEQVCFKTGPFAPKDLRLILEIASEAGVDLVTFDGAGGGTGHSPVKMMNEWGIPTVQLEQLVFELARKLHHLGRPLPQIAIAGGFATEDQVFKGLALGAPYIGLVALGRAAMTAAMVGQRVGEALQAGEVPKEYACFGSSVEELFADLRILKGLYGSAAGSFAPGAIGVFSYLNRVSVGLRQLMALNRKFALEHLDRNDLIPLTEAAARATGLPTVEDLTRLEVEEMGK